MSKIGIVIPILNNFKGSVETIESVRTSHQWEPIVLPQWRRNRPLSAAWNIGISKALNERDCDYALVINDDILFAPHTIDNLVREYQNLPEDVLLLSACNVRSHVTETYGTPYGVFELPDPGVSGNFSECPDFSCFMVDNRLFPRVGQFDENFIPAYFEDNDMHTRINLLGFRAGATGSAQYYHAASQTQKPDSFHQMFESNRDYYISKWGGMPHQETYKTPFNRSDTSPKEW